MAGMASEHPPVASGASDFRVPTERAGVASRAQGQALTLGIIVGGAIVALGTWGLVSSISGGREPDSNTSLPAIFFILFGLAVLVAMVAAVNRWRRNLRQAVGDDGVVLAVDGQRVGLGAFGPVDWTEIREIEFRDRRSGDGVFRGTPGAYGRVLGFHLRMRGGKSEMDVLVTLHDAARARAAERSGAASGMVRDEGGRAVLRLPFGAALPVTAFHDAFRAVETVAAARGVAVRYDDGASV
ncbi:hypothetical protein QFZ26_000819 [Agromyces ramosus]|uniref:Uncharacterized protein n=2 Tax=Agromyces ramosus TaxID=33879 RepID=A0ABU0R5B5_9MICO|nr:hypothetical protein [Agromyces ramosus]